MKLSDLFSRCLKISYQNVENGASFATEIIGKTLYIYFESSNGVVDWENNLDFPCRCGSDFCYHRGFFSVWESVKSYIIPYINNKEYQEIVIVGYSHGAALAVLCFEAAFKLRDDISSNIFGIGFGCPRVLWGFKRKKAKKIFKEFLVVRNSNDIVTHLPPAILGYFHVGKILKIGEKGKYSKIQAHAPESILAELENLESNFNI